MECEPLPRREPRKRKDDKSKECSVPDVEVQNAPMEVAPENSCDQE